MTRQQRNANAALIDDELANTKASKQLICDPNNYTIYERFQDIEHALDGDELILTIWKNWGTRTDVQFKLKIKKRREEPVEDDDDDRMSTKSKVSMSIIEKLTFSMLKDRYNVIFRRYAMRVYKNY